MGIVPLLHIRWNASICCSTWIGSSNRSRNARFWTLVKHLQETTILTEENDMRRKEYRLCNLHQLLSLYHLTRFIFWILLCLNIFQKCFLILICLNIFQKCFLILGSWRIYYWVKPSDEFGIVFEEFFNSLTQDASALIGTVGEWLYPIFKISEDRVKGFKRCGIGFEVILRNKLLL